MLDPTIVFFFGIILLQLRIISAQERGGDKDFIKKKTLSYGICKKKKGKKVVKKKREERRLLKNKRGE
jgi:hypothetical protein